MRKKWPIILVISIPLAIFLLCFVFFEIYKEFESHTQSCIDQQSLNISENFSELTGSLCLTGYQKNGDDTYIQFNDENTLEQVLITQGWSTSAPNTYVKNGYVLTLGQNTIEIFKQKIDSQTATETDSTSPQQVVSPTNTPYKISSQEISKIATTQKIVVFTFDGGSGVQSLEQILTVLKKYDVKSTFFLTGKWAEANPTAVKQISNAGHEIFNHTYSHPDLATVSDAEITHELVQTEDILFNLTGKSTKPFFRPPYGSRNSHIREFAASLGYQDVYWTVDALDWKESTGITADQVKSRILDNLAPGNIYLMHIGDNLTGQVLDSVLATVKANGYSVFSLYDAVTKYGI